VSNPGANMLKQTKYISKLELDFVECEIQVRD